MKVADVMTKDVLWLEADEPVSLAAWTMAAEFISGAPVRDRAGKLVGVLSNADVAHHVAPVMNTRVSAMMTPAVVSISEGASLGEAVRLFAERGIHRIVVTGSTGAVVGVLTALDVLRGIHLSGDSALLSK
ncbi:MAG TPA: CBS domain-containing protein [Polyangiaceae bacterium]|jgi:predicted transcriptional regulator|nr:CBS domain-containing protein [Polyangiaceae bacterium]